MGLSLHSLKLTNFRNYESFESGEFDQMNIFIGKNGTGKTNIVEAIQLITALESFRRPKWDEIIRWGSEDAEIIAREIGDKRDLELKLYIKENKRRYFLNSKGRKRKDLLGQLPAILFCPDDLQIVKGYSEIRREALDSIGSQISSTYTDLKNDYLKSVRQKNILLQSGNANDSLLESWNENIMAIGSSFVRHRINLFIRFRSLFFDLGNEMLPDLSIDIAYIPSWVDGEKIEIREKKDIDSDDIAKLLKSKLESHKIAEISSGRVLIGPHRDDVRFYIKNYDAKKYASQGQQRFISLLWKISEMRIIESLCGQEPILLLDDVMSELDREKREILFKYLMKNTQTFLTAVEIDDVDKTYLKNAKIFEVGR